MSDHRSSWVDLGHDLKHAARAIRSRPWFALLVVATMAVGIGATVGVYAFLSYFAYPKIDAPGNERLVWLHRVTEDGSAPGTSLDDWRDLETGTSELFDRVAGWRLFGASLQGPDRTRQAWGHAVSGGYFALFGARPLVGRLLGPDDDRPGAPPVVVLSYLTWRGQFDSDPRVVGKTVLLNGKLPFTVVGVAREGFQGEGIWTGIYAPLATTVALVSVDREVSSMGRLRPGVTPAQAEPRLAELARRCDEARPLPAGKRTLRLVPTSTFEEAWRGDPLFVAAKVLMVTVSLLLALACANVANLLLARGAARRRELAVHAALGAGRGRLARRLGIESLMLSLTGGALGLLLARWLTRLIETLLRREIPVSMGDWGAGTVLTIDLAEIALFSATVSVGCGLLFGLAPVFQIARADLVAAVRGGSSTSRAGWRSRYALLSVQIALSVALLAGASLLSRTLFAARALDLGFDERDLLLATVFVPRGSAAEGGAGGAQALQAELLRQVRDLPGVDSAALVFDVPLGPGGDGSKAELAGERAELNTHVVGDGYLETLGVELVEGRGFGSGDTAAAPRVLIVNRATAERYWPGRSPIGERIVLHPRGFEEAGQAHEVIGVAANSRYLPAPREIEPLAYLPLSQNPRARTTILVRARTPLAGPLHDLLRNRYPDLAVVGVVPFEAQIERGLAIQTMNAQLSGALALLGLVFAFVGIFGVVSYTVAQRTREIGIRVAIGATGGEIRRWALGTTVRPLALGLALGLAAAVGLGMLLESLLVGVGRFDAVSFASAPLLIAVAALLASWLPARRATRVDPAVVLRDS